MKVIEEIEINRIFKMKIVQYDNANDLFTIIRCNGKRIAEFWGKPQLSHSTPPIYEFYDSKSGYIGNFDHTNFPYMEVNEQ